ncbi:hypothetical protein C8J57DRAFT_1247465 [Mycena rebaudengoi]|nr:hypothetical protein C8J57DRAFT_1247465 [Mycena rebaudengoi]
MTGTIPSRTYYSTPFPSAYSEHATHEEIWRSPTNSSTTSSSRPPYSHARSIFYEREYSPLERISARTSRVSTSSPTKVDTLGTVDTLAGRAVSTFDDDLGRPKDPTERSSRRGIPLVSGLAPPTSRFQGGALAFGTRAFPTSSPSFGLQKNLSNSPPKPSATTSRPSSTLLASRGVVSSSSLSPFYGPRGTNTPTSRKKLGINPFQVHQRRTLSPISERVSVGGEITSPRSDSSVSMADLQAPKDDRLEEARREELGAPTMEELVRRFYKDEEDLEDEYESMDQSIHLLSLKVTLETKDIMDRGSQNRHFSRYRLELDLLNRIQFVSSELQSFIQSAAGLVEGRTRHFRIDPGRALIPILSNASDIPQMEAAWDILRNRLVLGQKFFDKYVVEYKQGISPLSPTSTTSDILEGLQNMPSLDQKLRHMKVYYPHHKEAESSPSRRLHVLTDDWQSLDAQEGPESNPKYAVQAEEEISYVQTQQDYTNVTVRDGKRRESGIDLNDSSSAERSLFNNPVNESLLGRIQPLPHPSPMKPPPVLSEVANTSGLLGSDGKFKSATGFLDRLAAECSVSVQSVPGASIQLNIMDRIAAGPLGSQGDRYRATFGNASAANTSMGSISSTGYHTASQNPRYWPNREAPPHFDSSHGNAARSVETYSAPRVKSSRDESPADASSQWRQGAPANLSSSSGIPPAPSRPPPPQEPSQAPTSGPTSYPSGSGGGGSGGGGGWGGGGWKPTGNGGGFGAGGSGGGAPGGSGGGHGGGGGAPGGGGGGGSPTPPYGTTVPTIDVKLKVADLPEWDRSQDTAVQYSWEVSQKAALGGNIPQVLGYWLGSRLVKGSPIQLWYSVLPARDQALMRTHYILYLQGIKDGYLGSTWQRRMNRLYEGQRFRQRGFELESPQNFITRRIMYTRMLVNTDDGGRGEVYHVMEKAPVSWSTVLVLENIATSTQLYSKATEHEQSLIHASKMEASKLLTAENLGAALKAHGFSVDKPRYAHQAQLGSKELPDLPDNEAIAWSEANTPEEDLSNDDLVLRQVYQVLKDRPKPPSPPYARDDSVMTKMGKLPPSPCRLCGSPKHWNKECPNYVVYDAGIRRNAKMSEVIPPSGDETMYQNAFTILLNQAITQSAVDFEDLGNRLHFKTASPAAQVEGYKTAKKVAWQHLESESNSSSQGSQEADVESEQAGTNINDERDLLERGDFPEDQGVIMEAVVNADVSGPNSPADETTERTDWQSKRRAREMAKVDQKAAEFWLNDGRMFPEADSPDDSDSDPDSDDEYKELEEKFGFKVEAMEGDSPYAKQEQTRLPSGERTSVRLHKRRNAPAGRSAMGTSVLSMKGWVGAVQGEAIDLRLDTCADITLISEDFYKALPNPPPIKSGIAMKLVQLTQEESGIQGFVSVPIFTTTEDGVLIETEAEAYVVPGMSVPILLGEDYQGTYELALTRSMTKGNLIHFNSWRYAVRAQSVSRTKDYSRILFSSQSLSRQAQAQSHRARVNKRRRKVKACGEELTIVRASRDYKIRPHECWSILVTGYFEEDREWLVEKTLLANTNDSYFAVPNVLISSLNPWIPVSNPTDQPRMIRRGEAIGRLVDPQSHFDVPSSPESRAEYEKAAEAMAVLIKANLEMQTMRETHYNSHEGDLMGCGKCFPREARSAEATTSATESNTSGGGQEDSEQTNEEDQEQQEAEDYGPKTAAMPDAQDYDSERMREIIDVGSLPEHLQEQAWDMLKRRVKAFGFDGRLGHYPGRVHIRTVDGQSEQTTIVIFARFHPKPPARYLDSGDNFLTEGKEDLDLCELRERYKGRCAPRPGQIFDPITGVERLGPYDSDEPGAISRFEEEQFLIPPPLPLGDRLLHGRRNARDSDQDATRIGRSIGPRFTSPHSDHSSERQSGDSSRPMHYTTGWAHSMAQSADNVGNYRDGYSRRKPDWVVLSRTSSPSFMDARSNVASSSASRSSQVQTSRSGSARRSASPARRVTGPYLHRARTPEPFFAREYEDASCNEISQRRAEWLSDFLAWGAGLTHTYILWCVPCNWEFNMDYMRDGYLLISDHAQVRLRYLAVALPRIQYLRQLLQVAIEHGIPFNVGLKTADCERYRPRDLDAAGRGITKASLMNTDHRLVGTVSPTQLYDKWMALVGHILTKPNARAVISRGGVVSWVARAYGYSHLVRDFMSGPLVQVSVYHAGANDSGDQDTINLHWDDLAEEDYLGVCGYIPGSSREADSYLYPTNEVLADLCKHFSHEWNAEVDDLFKRIKAEWEERPCRGRARTRKEWKTFFHSTNHGDLAPTRIVDRATIDEGRARLNRAFATRSWHKARIWDIRLPEVFRPEF